jgi:hypothetical protein
MENPSSDTFQGIGVSSFGYMELYEISSHHQMLKIFVLKEAGTVSTVIWPPKINEFIKIS